MVFCVFSDQPDSQQTVLQLVCTIHIVEFQFYKYLLLNHHMKYLPNNS